MPPFESETALKIVEEELGAPISKLFEQFDPDPIAAASLGIVFFLLKMSNACFSYLMDLS